MDHKMDAAFVCYLQFTAPNETVVDLEIWCDPNTGQYFGVDTNAFTESKVTINNPYADGRLSLEAQKATKDNSMTIEDCTDVGQTLDDVKKMQLESHTEDRSDKWFILASRILAHIDREDVKHGLSEEFKSQTNSTPSAGISCEWCGKQLNSQSGRTLHLKTCTKAPYVDIFQEDL